MGRCLTSGDVAVWLRVQIAAGRVSRQASLGDLKRLSHCLSVDEETVSAAFVLIDDDYSQVLCGPSLGTEGGYRMVADLIDQIASASTIQSGSDGAANG